MGVWVQEDGESEGRSAIERIGVEPTWQDHPTRKRADFHLVLSHKNTDQPIKEAKQMTVTQTGAASHDLVAGWHDLDWKAITHNVRRLQARIVKATKEGKWGKVKALQRLLTRSFSGKALAVRRVTDNDGSTTPGVDQVTWDTPEKKAQAVVALKQRGYHPQPLRRIYIPKRNGKKRPLGIPMWAAHCLSFQAKFGIS